MHDVDSVCTEKDRWDFQAGESAHPDASSDDITAVVEEAVDVGEVWEAGNAVQESIEAALKTATLPAMPDAQSYGTQRLQQVSEMSRRIEDEYHKLFLQVRTPAPAHHEQHAWKPVPWLL